MRELKVGDITILKKEYRVGTSDKDNDLFRIIGIDDHCVGVKVIFSRDLDLIGHEFTLGKDLLEVFIGVDDKDEDWEEIEVEWEDEEDERDPYFGVAGIKFSDPATIVFWADGTKTVVKAQDEPFDKEKGLAMAIMKRVFTSKDFGRLLKACHEDEDNEKEKAA